MSLHALKCKVGPGPDRTLGGTGKVGWEFNYSSSRVMIRSNLFTAMEVTNLRVEPALGRPAFWGDWV